MIPADFITEWRQVAPWPSDEQVEQDLIISRAIVEMYSREEISRRLAWRGGTAPHSRRGPGACLECFHRYMSEGSHTMSRAQFEDNLAGKRVDPRFTSDIEPLLGPGTEWDLDTAMDTVLDELITKIPGAPWSGSAE